MKYKKHGSTELSLQQILINLCVSIPAEVEMRKMLLSLRDYLKAKLHPLAACFEQQKGWVPKLQSQPVTEQKQFPGTRGYAAVALEGRSAEVLCFSCCSPPSHQVSISAGHAAFCPLLTSWWEVELLSLA